MKRRPPIQLLAILLALFLTDVNCCVAQGRNGLKLIEAPWLLKDAKLTDVTLEDLCAVIEAEYNVDVFLEKGIQATVSLDGKGSKFPQALKQILKPHDLHFRLDLAGLYISRKPIPDNVILLPGDVQLEVAIPTGREQVLSGYGSSSGSSKWEQGDSKIFVAYKIVDKTLKQIAEDSIERFTKSYKVTQQQTNSITNGGKDYLALRVVYQPTKEILHAVKEQSRKFEETSRKVEESMSRQFKKLEPEKRKKLIAERLESMERDLRLAASEMVTDEILFKNGDYLYTVKHTYPKSAANAGSTLSKRLLETINWEQTSKFQRVR